MLLSLLFGLTGGMGTGKTLAASIFKELGAHILDADLICRILVEPGQPALKEISECFGENILDKSRNLDRKKLAQIILYSSFSNANTFGCKMFSRIFFFSGLLKIT